MEKIHVNIVMLKIEFLRKFNKFNQKCDFSNFSFNQFEFYIMKFFCLVHICLLRNISGQIYKMLKNEIKQ